ncbi:hypothetical protein ACJMK2_039007 [Sinanodonta woodiana]|uniref:CABIT domain-containing protein n=1 Tax=Sinanodonta woodiana TaxID=1069815 RepID=A0ABD3WE27_SINWO
MATSNANQDSIMWSEETYRLDEVSSHFKLPIMVRVNEGIYGCLESETFSANDIIKLEKEVSLAKIAAHFIHDFNEWRSKTRSDYEQYLSLKEISEILIPIHYKGKLQLISDETICESVSEISTVKSKFIMVLKNLVVPKSNGTITIEAGTVLEIDFPASATSGKGGNRTMLVCRYNLNKTTYTVELPMTMKGKFKSIHDDTKYTLQHVIDNYELPQAVKFVDSDIAEMYSRDIVDGVENMVHFSGMVSLNRLVMQKVLIGYYKRLDTGYTIQNRFFRRPIVVIPLDSDNVKNIEVSVPQILPEDNEIYEFFIANNFSFDRTCDLTSVDGNLYAEFVKCPKVYIMDNDPPPIPPQHSGSNDSPPQVPRRPNKSIEISSPIRPKDCASKTWRSPEPDPKIKVVEHLETKARLPLKVSQKQSTSTEERIYDYPDLSQMDLYFDKKPVAHVTPHSKTVSHQNHSNKPFKDLTVSELCERLKRCGFENLIKVCESQKLDGQLMYGLEEKILVRCPFNLTEFQVRKYRDMVYKNWVPKLN